MVLGDTRGNNAYEIQPERRNKRCRADSEAVEYAQFYSGVTRSSDCERRQGFRGLILGPVFTFKHGSTSITASPHAVT